MKGIGILPGPRGSYIDHIASLCQIMEIPLLCTDRAIGETVDIFYPQMSIFIEEAVDFSLERVLKDYDTFFYVDHHRLPQGAFKFFEYFYRGNARSVCGLHGNSDKKRNLFWAERYADEDVVLLYGEHMVDFLKEKGVWDRFHRAVLTGNFRKEFYHQNKSFFDRRITPFLFPKNNKKTLLYCPTWTSSNRRSDWRVDYTSFFDVYPFILDVIPDDYQVIVKLHPQLVLFFPTEIEEIKERYSDSEKILFLPEMPLIYPLLSSVDVYLGDYSSVGYDFLSFNRPMFFINDQQRDAAQDKGVYFHRCGIPLSKQDLPHLYSFIDKHPQNDLTHVRQEVYHYAFGEDKPLSCVRKEIEQAL